MGKRQFCFSGIKIEVEMPEEKFYKDEYRLAPFRMDQIEESQENEMHKMRFRWVPEISAPKGVLVKKYLKTHIYMNEIEKIQYLGVKEDDWRNARIRVSHKDKIHEVEVNENEIPGEITLKTVLECMSVEALLIAANSFILHCSYIEVNGQAILFTAPSGTGKSTQAELWRQIRGAEIINGDRGAIRLSEGEIVAEGIPFAGSSEYCLNRSMPLSAIVYLEQAPVTSIRRLQGYEGFSAVWKGCSVNQWDRNDVELLSGMVMKVTKKVPIFYLQCTPDETAVIALENALKEMETA